MASEIVLADGAHVNGRTNLGYAHHAGRMLQKVGIVEEGGEVALEIRYVHLFFFLVPGIG